MPFAVGTVNAYLLTGEPLTLVDCGPKDVGTLTALEAELVAHDLRVEDIELLVLTHQHYDHAGLAGTIRDRSGCRVAGHALLAEVMRDFTAAMDIEDDYEVELLRLNGAPEEIVGTVRSVSAGARRFADSVMVDVPLEEGDVLEAGGRRLRVRLRPGHSPTDTIFVDEACRWALVGDHVLARSPVTAVLHRPLGGAPSGLPTYLESLQATAALGLNLAYTGHGPTVHDPACAVAERVASCHRRAERILAVVGPSPQTAWSVVESVWGMVGAGEGHPISVAYLALSDVVGHLALLVAAGRVREQHADGHVRYTAVGI